MRARIYPSLLCLMLVACGSNKSAGSNDGGSDAGVDMAGPDSAGADRDSDGETPDGGDDVAPDAVRGDLVWLLDDVEIDITDGYSDRVAFNVPDNAVSVVVSITGEGGTSYTLSEWRNGDDSSLVRNGWVDADAGAPGLCLSCDNRIASSEASFAAIAPNSENPVLVPGGHYISVFAYRAAGFAVSKLTAGKARVKVLAKLGDAEPAEGVLDLNFYFTGAAGLTADSAPTDVNFQQTLTDLRELYGQVGVELGVVTYSDISEEFRIIESVITANSDLQEMFLLSSEAPRNALNIFVVEELMTGLGGGFGVLLGVSGGIPGPPIGATHRSGVAVATKREAGITTELYKVIGHEVGHHLGLFHTSEQDFGAGAQVHDPIGDTPENDQTLLMFNSGSGDTLSVQQGRVMRLNPWVRTAEEGE